MYIVRIRIQVFFDWGGGCIWWEIQLPDTLEFKLILLAKNSLISPYFRCTWYFQKNNPQQKRGFTVLVFLYTSVKLLAASKTLFFGYLLPFGLVRSVEW